MRNIFREGLPGLWLRAALLPEEQKSGLEERLPLRYGIPRLFYASRLFSPMGGPRARLSSAVEAFTSLTLDEGSLCLFERLLASINAQECDRRGRIVCEMSGGEAPEPFDALFLVQIALTEGATRVQFPLFEGVETEGGAVRFVVSRPASLLWRLDTVLHGDAVRVIHALANPASRLAARAALGQYYDEGYHLKLSKAGEIIGFDAGYVDTTMVVKADFAATDTDAIGLRCSMRGIEFTGRKPEYTYLPPKLVKRVKVREYEAFFDEVARPVEKTKKTSSKKPAAKREGTFFKAERLEEGQAEGFVEIAKQVFEEWVDETALEEVFSQFRDYWTTERRAMKKNWKLAWRNWLKKRDAGYAPVYFPLEKALEAAEAMEIDRGTAVMEFANFKRYYHSRGEVRKRWLPAWEAWLERSKERARKEALTGDGLERQFYLARLVSAEIEEIIYQAGSTPAEVIAGERVFDDIVWRSVPVPPTGKESVTLFAWRDDGMQAAAMGRYLDAAAAPLAAKGG